MAPPCPMARVRQTLRWGELCNTHHNSMGGRMQRSAGEPHTVTAEGGPQGGPLGCTAQLLMLVRHRRGRTGVAVTPRNPQSREGLGRRS